MLRVLYVCVAEQHDLRLVALAAFVCLFACFTATNLYVRAEESHRARRLLWMSGAAVVFGCGVWTTHFVAELAYRPGLPIVYDESLTALSAVIAVVLAGVGFAIATQYGAVKLGGAVVGAAVGAMHFTGVAAMRAPAIFHWSPAYVVASIVVGMALSSVAFAVLSQDAGLGRRLAATGLLVLAIVSLHFTAMAALSLEFDPSVDLPLAAFPPNLMAVAVAGVTAVIITIGLAGAVTDDRLARQATDQAAHLTELVAARTAELHQAQAELLRNERLSTMGQLTATVAHELRNPLSAARNSLFIIRKMLDDQGIDLDRPIARVERSVARCERIISDLLDYTRGRELRRANLAFETWLEETLREQTLPEGITLVRDFHAADARVSCDTGRMRRVVDNLIENAVQAIAEAGSSGRIEVSTHTTQGVFEFAIADSGPGVAPEVLPRVFEPLYSTKGFGTGLGLPAVKQIVEQHGGDVRFDSTQGKGARVAIRLPLVEPRAIAA
ncbi:MAG TPA: MHYT domain-containing protein [Stellaceae bacterium]|nr:MHYT domain-containing protein [Stellaceae bacterium]